MTALDDLAAVLDAASAHRPRVEDLLTWACYSGDCDNAEHEKAGECPTAPVTVCGACFDLAHEINDECVPDEVLANRCPVCLAWMLSTAHTVPDGRPGPLTLWRAAGGAVALVLSRSGRFITYLEQDDAGTIAYTSLVLSFTAKYSTPIGAPS